MGIEHWSEIGVETALKTLLGVKCDRMGKPRGWVQANKQRATQVLDYAVACCDAAAGSALISTLRGRAEVAMGALISSIPLRYSAVSRSFSTPSGSRKLCRNAP